MDLAIINTWLMTFQGESLGIIENGALGIEGNTINYVGPTKEFDYKNADKIIDGGKHVTMPGLVNAHIHTGITILRGGAQDLPEIEWMNKGIGPLAKHLQPKDFILGAQLGVLEALRTGTTTFAEYTGNVEKLVEEVYLPFGARVVATETINEVSSNRAHLKPTDLYEFDRTKGEKSFQRNAALFDKYREKELVSCMYGPQALDMISLELLESIKEAALDQESKIHMHVAQGGRERLQITGRYGKDSSTVKVLAEHGFLDEHLIAAHCHDTTEEERATMVNKGVKMVGCPSSISMIDGIVPPVDSFVSFGGDVGLGTDQAPGPGLHNMFREMRTISLLTKTTKKDPTALPAWEVLRLATSGGAKILNLEKKIGSLEIGKKADIIMIDCEKPNLTPLVAKPFRNFVPNIVYSSYGNEVDHIIINGQLIMEKDEFVEIDEKAIIKEANGRARRLFEEATDDWKKAGSKLVKYAKEGFL
ncbi:MAG: amidohydrolase family protein [Candidatus Heimdallarchaeota archaeon]|nr:amidohydrolase family protein [Candidatus Heimdallarchaeota archaeon]